MVGGPLRGEELQAATDKLAMCDSELLMDGSVDLQSPGVKNVFEAVSFAAQVANGGSVAVARAAHTAYLTGLMVAYQALAARETLDVEA